MSDADADQLSREITTYDAEAGSTLFEEGDPADGVAAILEGTVEVTKHGRVLATLGPGSVLGELSVFTLSATRTATARATTPVRTIKWRADDVRGRLARHERLATAMVADMAFVLAVRLDRWTQDVISLLRVDGTRLPVSELERFRSHALEWPAVGCSCVGCPATLRSSAWSRPPPRSSTPRCGSRPGGVRHRPLARPLTGDPR